MLARVQDIASAPLPPLAPADPRHFNQCLRVMLAVLPKRSSDEISGELFVAAYQKKLGHLSDSGISFIADKAMERCQWFPTIAECLEIYEDWRRVDEAVQRRIDARRIVNAERDARQADMRAWRQHDRHQLTQSQVDQMSEQLISIGLACRALMHDETGKVVPWAAKPGEEIF